MGGDAILGQLAAIVALLLLAGSPALADSAGTDADRGDDVSGYVGRERPAGPTDRIPYRLLARADFLGATPPRRYVHRSDHLSAVSCLGVEVPPDLPVELSRRGVGEGALVVASLPTPRFIAVFDRLCSWWNPAPVDPAHVLEHEQVHFAITEYAARELSREQGSATLRGYGADEEAAISHLKGKIRKLARRAMQSARREHEAFDAATSAVGSEGHLEWLHRYGELLEEVVERVHP